MEESWRSNKGSGIMEREPSRMHHGGGTIEEAAGGGSQEEAIRRRQLGGTRRHPGGARRFPGGTQEAPGGTQEAPRFVCVSVSVPILLLLQIVCKGPRETPVRSRASFESSDVTTNA